MPASTFRLDNRKLDMLERLRKYELLTTHQAAILDGGSEQTVSRILHRLELAGYLLRPYGQRQSFHDRREPWVHGLSNAGADLISERRSLLRGKLDWTKKNRIIRGNYKHKLLINEFRAHLAADVRNRPHIGYLEESSLLKCFGATSKTWRVPVLDEGKVVEMGVTTDYFFRLVFHQEPKPNNFATFAFEADRGTEPHDTETDRLEYLYRKMLAYYFTYMLGIHTQLFGFQEFRVPILTTSPKRVENFLEINKRFNNGEGSELFLFTDKDSFCISPYTLEHRWVNGRGEEVTLLD